MGAFSTLTIIYVATDAAGNEANCKFDITVEGKKCCKHILSFCTIHHFIYLHCFVVFLFSIDTPFDKLALKIPIRQIWWGTTHYELYQARL